MTNFDPQEFAEFVSAHGLGDPTAEAYGVGRELLEQGDDYATIAHEIVARKLTTDTARIKPVIKAVALDETSFWDEDFRERLGVTKIEKVCIYDAAQHTHICSFTPSYLLYHVDTVVTTKFEPGSIEDSVAWDQVHLHDHSEIADYYNVSSIDRLEGQITLNEGEGYPAASDDKHLQAYLTGELDYDEYFEGWIEYARGNAIF